MIWIDYYSVYEVVHGERQLVLTAASMKEAEWAFDELKRKVPKYQDKKIDWKYTYFDDEPAVGEVR
jgi:hypothetical protein